MDDRSSDFVEDHEVSSTPENVVHARRLTYCTWFEMQNFYE